LVTIRGQGGRIGSNRWQGQGHTADFVPEARLLWRVAKSESSVAIDGQGSVVVSNLRLKSDSIIHRGELAGEDDH
jgi:hypothetical protein